MAQTPIEKLAPYLVSDEDVQWLTESGKQSETSAMAYWVAYPVIATWIFLSAIIVTGSFEPAISSTLKFLMAIFLGSCGAIVLFYLMNRHRKNGFRIFAVTKKRLIVLIPGPPMEVTQSTYDELGSIRFSPHQPDGLVLLPKNRFSLNAFYRGNTNKWHGLENPAELKKLIEAALFSVEEELNNEQT